MPQLDLFTYLSQYLWFCVGFFIFYFSLLYLSLPIISFNLKFRKKKMALLVSALNNNTNSSSMIYDSFFSKFCAVFLTYILNLNKFLKSFLLIKLNSINSTFFFEANTSFIKKYLYNLYCFYLFDDSFTIQLKDIKTN